jgi:hypothetical protein
MIEHVSEQDLLLAFDGELPSDRQDAVRAHTRACAACDQKWNSLANLSEQVTAMRPSVGFQSEQAAVGQLVASLTTAPAPRKAHWTSRWLAVANTLVAVAIAITCIVLLPSLHVINRPAAHPAAVYEVDQSVPQGFVSLPFADPALPLDDATVMPVELSAEDLALMGVDANDVDGEAPQGAVKAEILIGVDGWPRAIRILE